MLKVREELPADGSDPGWYQHPAATLASLAPAEDLKRDGIELPKDLPNAPLTPRKTNDPVCGPGSYLVKAGC